jgi:hypothetical protein
VIKMEFLTIAAMLCIYGISSYATRHSGFFSKLVTYIIGIFIVGIIIVNGLVSYAYSVIVSFLYVYFIVCLSARLNSLDCDSIAKIELSKQRLITTIIGYIALITAFSNVYIWHSSAISRIGFPLALLVILLSIGSTVVMIFAFLYAPSNPKTTHTTSLSFSKTYNRTTDQKLYAIVVIILVLISVCLISILF